MTVADNGGCDIPHIPQVPVEAPDREIDNPLPKLEGICHTFICTIVTYIYVVCSLTCDSDVHEGITTTLEDCKDKEVVHIGTQIIMLTCTLIVKD